MVGVVVTQLERVEPQARGVFRSSASTGRDTLGTARVANGVTPTAKAGGYATTAVRPRPNTGGRPDETRAPIDLPQPRQHPPTAATVPDSSRGTSAEAAQDGTSQRTWTLRYSRVLPALDAAIASSAAAVAMWLFVSPRAALTAGLVAATFVVALLVATASAGAYDVPTVARPQELRRLSNAVLRVAALLGVVGYLTASPYIGPLLLVALPVSWLLLTAVRIVGRARLRQLHRRGTGRRTVIVIGTERASAELIRRLGESSEHSFDVVGVLTDTSIADNVEGVPVLGSTSSLGVAVTTSGATTVLVAPWSPISQDGVRRLSWESAELGVEFLLSPNVVDVDGHRIQVEMAAGVPFLNVQHPKFGGTGRRLQCFFDRSVAFLALVMLSPVLAATALAVRLNSPGGALFRQQRIGQGGEPFVMYKFRSMSTDAEAQRHTVLHHNKHGGGPLFKAVGDPRITKVGKVLRRFSLDELPQLWNVAKGDMALVGPRPPLPIEVAEYDSATLRRLLVRPGLTGLWQVSGRSDLPWEESVRLDLYYVDNRSVAADLAIIGRTGSAVIAGRGAY